MAVRQGFGKVVTDGLVFAYDTGDTVNSYKGEPTTNIFLNPTFIGTPGTQTDTISDNWYFSGYSGLTGFRYYDSDTSPIALKFPKEGAVITTGPNSTSNRRFYCTATLEAGATYTVSAWIYISTSGTSIAHFEYGGSNLNSGYFPDINTHANYKAGEWFYWEDTYTVGADYNNGLIGPVHSRTKNSLLGIQRFQIEKKGHVTPFVNGNRSDSGSLLDLTGGTSIDLANTSFDSNAQIDFDGTDDYVEISDSTLFDFGTGDFSMEAVVKGTGTSNYRTIFYHFYNPGFVYITMINTGVMRVWIHNKVLNGNTNILDGEYHHTVFVREGDTLTFYVDGEKDASSTGWSAKNATNTAKGASIGRYIDGLTHYPWDGEIPSLKAYNRALTAGEVKQNFAMYKNRFNI